MEATDKKDLPPNVIMLEDRDDMAMAVINLDPEPAHGLPQAPEHRANWVIYRNGCPNYPCE